MRCVMSHEWEQVAEQVCGLAETAALVRVVPCIRLITALASGLSASLNDAGDKLSLASSSNLFEL